MALALVCDNCGNGIEATGVRYHLQVLDLRETTDYGVQPRRVKRLDLCSKSCVLQSDKDLPEEPA